MRHALIATLLLSSISLQIGHADSPRAKKFGSPEPILFGTQQGTEQEIRDSIKAVDVLLKKESAAQQKDTLVLNRVNFLLLLARLQLVKNTSAASSKIADKTLSIAKIDVDALLAKKTLNREMTGKALLLSGLIAMYRDQDYVTPFTQALGVYPQSESSPWISLVLGEYYFEKGNFQAAEAAYSKFFHRNDARQKEMALYKLGWCYINKKDYTQAEKFFVRLIRGGSKSEYAVEGIKDLAYVMSLSRSDDEIVAIEKNLFKTKDGDAEIFLSRLIDYRAARQELSPNSPLLKAYAELNNPLRSKFALALLPLKSTKLEYASHAHLKAYQAALVEFKKEKTDQKLLVAWQQETEEILKSLVETRSGKVKSPEAWSPQELSGAIKTLTTFYLETFPGSPATNQIVKVRRDICTEVKDYACMMQTQNYILKDPKQAAFHQEATLEILRIWDELYRKNPGQFRARAVKQGLEFLKKYPDSKSAELTAYRVSEYFADAKDYSSAMKVLNNSFAKTNNQETFFKLQTMRFKEKMFKEILADTRVAPTTPRFVELRREAALQKAITDKAAGDLANYQRSIASFLETNPSPEKTKIAKVDLLSTLVDAKAYDSALQTFAKLGPSEQKNAAFQPILMNLWTYAFNKGDFEAAGKIIPNSPERQYSYLRLLNDLASDQLYSSTELKKMDRAKRTYLQNLMLVTKPSTLWVYFQQNPPEGWTEKNLAEWAYRLSKNSLDIPKSRATVKVFGPDYRFHQDDPRYNIILKQIAAVSVPSGDMLPKVFTQTFARALRKTQALRGDVTFILKKLSSEQQETLAGSMSELENKMAGAIRNSPLPDNLSEEQVSQYKSGLEKAAKEFDGQSTEFKKIAVAASEKKLNEQREFGQSDPKWPLNNLLETENAKPIGGLMAQNRTLAALVVSDMQNEKNKQSPETYYRLKLGILRPVWESSPLLKKYLSAELKNAGQLELVNEWKAKGKEG